MELKTTQAIDKHIDKLRQVSKAAKNMSEIVKEIIKDSNDRDLIKDLTESFLELGIVEKDMEDLENYICSKIKYNGGA